MRKVQFSETRSPEDKYKEISSAFRLFPSPWLLARPKACSQATSQFSHATLLPTEERALRDEPKKGRFGRASLVAMRSWQICPYRTGDEPVAVCFCDLKETAESYKN